eukprot:9485447-Pyramimonas_sp.AAC.1
MAMGMELSDVLIKRFADGEVYVQLQESIRGCDVFLIQSTCPSVNDNLIELLVMIDACRRASARNVTAVIPYFGYARADRKVRPARPPMTRLSSAVSSLCHMTSFYKSSCANNGEGALNTPESAFMYGFSGVLSAPLPLLAQEDP